MRSARGRARRFRRWVKVVLGATLFGMLAAGIGGGILVLVIWKRLPAPEALFNRRVIQSTKIYDRSGSVLLYEVHGEERRTVIAFADIPDVVKQATIAVEDANFYRHGGIDPRGVLRALITDIRRGELRQGGSTITQQLVKKSFFSDEQTLTRKFKEAILAIAIEARFPKDQILAAYLNQIPYGSNAYGIEAAAETYFGKHARELSAAEAALLAALPRAPSYYSPYGQHKDDLIARKNYVIGRMEELGYLGRDDAERARREAPKLLPATKNIRAPHFVMYVRDYLIQRYGEEEVEQGGLTVTTTLDWEWQEEAERLVRENAERNEQLIKARNMALVAMDPKTGEIRAMVGSRDYFDIAGDGNFNVATALRQPGSAFKPFVYAAAFQKGYTPETILFDVPTEFNPLCGPDGTPRPGSRVNPDSCYHPQDYDETFRGPVTLRQALAQSLNVPSVKLLYLVGTNAAIKTAEDLGITSLTTPERYGLSLVLGGAEVRLLEMVSAYGVFANDGVRNPPTAILNVTAPNGDVLEEKAETPRLVLDQSVARTINDLLSDNNARIPVFQPRSSLYFPEARVAAKTGTTQDYRDAWTIGYAPNVAVGVWAGNNDNSPIQQKGSGVMAAAPTWHTFMEFALQKVEPQEFVPPEGGSAGKPILRGIWQGSKVVTIDSISQKLATEYTPPETRRDVAFGDPHDPLYWINGEDPLGPAPEDPRADSQYENWEAAFQVWFRGADIAVRPLDAIPTASDDIHAPEKQPRVAATATAVGTERYRIDVQTDAPFGIREITIAAGDRVLASRVKPPPETQFLLSTRDLATLSQTIDVRAYDPYGNMGHTNVTIP